jgi:C1A family cysteine protease
MQHIADFGLSYGTIEEFNFRLNQFEGINSVIEEHNNTEGVTHKLGHNFLSTWTDAEKKRLMGYRSSPIPKNKPTILTPSNEDSVNWVTKGAVTPVKDQGQCGSCWSFSTTGSLEGAHQIASGNLLSFSEQQLVSCDKPLNHGCNGGNMLIALHYYKSHFAELESVYPYTSGKGVRGECMAKDKSKTAVEITSAHEVLPADVTQFKAALAKQPLSIAVAASKPAFHQYTSGIITKDCGLQLDHGVLAVGYGTDASG